MIKEVVNAREDNLKLPVIEKLPLKAKDLLRQTTVLVIHNHMYHKKVMNVDSAQKFLLNSASMYSNNALYQIMLHRCFGQHLDHVRHSCRWGHGAVDLKETVHHHAANIIAVLQRVPQRGGTQANLRNAFEHALRPDSPVRYAPGLWAAWLSFEFKHAWEAIGKVKSSGSSLSNSSPANIEAIKHAVKKVREVWARGWYGPARYVKAYGLAGVDLVRLERESRMVMFERERRLNPRVWEENERKERERNEEGRREVYDTILERGLRVRKEII